MEVQAVVMILFLLLTAHCLLPTAFMLSSDAMPGWRNGRRYGLKIR